MSAPCTSFAPIVQRLTPSIRPPLGRPGAPCAAPAARKSGWRARRMRSSQSPAMAEAGRSAREREIAAEWDAAGGEDDAGTAPHVDSPSIAGDWQSDDDASPTANPTGSHWSAIPATTEEVEREPRGAWFGDLLKRNRPAQRRKPAGAPHRTSHHGRRDGRAGRGAAGLARRRGAAVAADRKLLQAGRA